MKHAKVLVIPDVHGFTEALELILKKFPDYHYVFLGDIVDRGPDVKGCYQILRRLHAAGKATLLMGNHEHMAWDVMYNQDKQYGGISWHHGLIQTLQSYGSEEMLDNITNFSVDLHWYLTNCQDYAIIETPNGGVLASHGASPVFNNYGEVVGLDHIWNRPGDKPQPLPENVEYSVHGHTPMENPYVNTAQAAVYLDLGMYNNQLRFSNRFAVLDVGERTIYVHTKEGTWVPNVLESGIFSPVDDDDD